MKLMVATSDLGNRNSAKAQNISGTRVVALSKMAAAASAACDPISDKRGTKQYRIKTAAVIARRAAEKALERARGH